MPFFGSSTFANKSKSKVCIDRGKLKSKHNIINFKIFILNK